MENITEVEKAKNAKKLEEYVQELEKRKEPVFLDKLELGAGEIYVGNLPDADKMQLTTRFLKDLQVLLSNAVLLLSSSTICLQEIAKKQGIEIEKILDRGDVE